jgi:hypothetical protein
MAILFGIDLPGVFQTAMGDNVTDLTLVVVASGTRSAGSLVDGTNPTSTSYAGRGVVEDYDESQIDGTIVQRGDRMATFLARSIAGGQVPKPNDQVIASGTTYRVVNVETDGGEAVYCCQVRRA